MRFRDLIEHNVKTKHPGFDKTKLRSIADEDDDNSKAPVADLGVFNSPALEPAPNTLDATAPGATAAGLQAPMTPGFE